MTLAKLAARWPHRTTTSLTTISLFACLLALSLCSLYVATASDLIIDGDSNRTLSNEVGASRLKARISLESKSFDLVEDESTKNHELGAAQEPANNTIASSSTTEKPKSKEEKKKRNKSAEKSSRRLSNIWSMFLPGSSSESADYENGESAAYEEAENAIVEQTPASAGAPSVATNETSNANQEQADERMVAKLNRQPAHRPVGDSMLGSTSVASAMDNSGHDVQRAGPKSTTSSSASEDSPVRLITGTLSSAPQGDPSAPNVNEIVSNIMSSINSKAPSTSNSEREREDSTSVPDGRDPDNEQSPVASGSRNKTSSSSLDNSQFERWLSRIKMQQASASGRLREPTTSSTTTPAPTSLMPQSINNETSKPIKASGAWHLRTSTSSGDSAKKSSKQQVAPQTPQAELLHSVKQSIRDVANKGLPKRTISQQAQHIDAYRLRYQSHPFQQQMRQQQTQLVHGIKYPAGQASTISVSTADGASNTSLAFGAHYIPQLSPIDSAQQPLEVSQVVNSTRAPHELANHNPASSEDSSNSTTNGEQQNVEQHNIYHSQDEILRQVTSAINFEQQQLMMNQKKEESSDGRRNGSSTSEDSFMTADGASRLMAAGSKSANSASESDGSVSRAPLEGILKAAGNSSTRLEPLDVDKSFNTLAERVQQLVAQQEKLQREQQQLLANASSGTAQQPSWLRASLLQQSMRGPDGLASLMSSLSSNQHGKPNQQQQSSLDQIRDLLQRHEKTRGELKSSQESMVELMKQMIQLKAPGSRPPEDRGNESNAHSPYWTHNSSAGWSQSPLANPIGDDHNLSNQSHGLQSEQVAKAPLGSSNFGWMPTSGQVGPRQQHAHSLASPALQMKGHVRFPNQAPQGQLIRQPPSGNNVGLMLAPSMDEIDGNYAVDQQIIGMPIALLNNNDELELSHGQLEEAARVAAEQLAVRPPLRANPHEQLHAQQLAAMNKNALQSSANNKAQSKVGGISKFVPRVAPNQVAQNRQQQPDQLTQVQKLLEANSAPANNGPSPAGSSSPFQNELLQHQHNLMQIERLVSLLPSEHRAQAGANLQDDRSQVNSSNHLESIANLLSNRPDSVELLAAFNQNHLKKEENRNNNHDQQTIRIKGDEVGRFPTSVAQGGQDAIPTRKEQQDMRLSQQQQQQQPQQQIEPSVIANVPQMVGHYGQVPRPASESLMHDFRPLLGQRAYSPPRGLHVAADEGPGPLVASTSMANLGGPPTKLREISFYRPFGFRGHHAVTYQASPAVAAMFPRFIAQPAGSPPAHHPNGRLMQVQAGRPGILRHMTPIRATINEGQRLISQMLPPQLADHLAHYHRYHHHQYPTHTNLGTLPIPPLRQHHLLSHPMRRSHSIARPTGRPLEADDKWARSRAHEEGASKNIPPTTRMRARHMPIAEEQSLEYDVANEDNQLIQVDDELMFATPEHPDVESESVQLVEQQLRTPARFLPEQGLGEHTKRLRPGRQMLSPAEQQRLHQSIDKVARFRVDKPSSMLSITHPCMPARISRNSSSSSTTTSSTTTAPPASTTQTSSTSTGSAISTLETNRNSPPTDADRST